MNEFKIIELQSTILASNPAYRVIYTMDCEFCFPSNTTEIWTVKGNMSYLFHHYSEEYNDLKRIQRIIDSFQILGEPKNANTIAFGSKEKDQKNKSPPWSGIDFINLTEPIAKAIGLEEIRGLLITDVTPGSPADRAGIRGGYIPLFVSEEGTTVNIGGDIIIGINNESITKFNRLLPKSDQTIILTPNNLTTASTKEIISSGKNVGDSLKLTILRNGKELKEINLTLAPRPIFFPYENVMAGIKLSYPSDWHIQQEDPGVILFNHRYSWDQGIGIHIYSSQNKLLDEIINKEINDLKNRNLIELIILKSNFTMLAGNPAYMIKFSYICPQENCKCSNDENIECHKIMLKEIRLWAVKGNKIYAIDIDKGDPSDNLKYWLKIEKTMESFQIVPSFESGIYSEFTNIK